MYAWTEGDLEARRKAVLCQWQAERKQTQASKAGWKGSGDKTYHKFMKQYTNFQWVNILPKDGWHLLVPHLFPPHLQITKLVSPISPGKEKKANRSHVQTMATWTPQKLRLLQPQCLGLWVLPLNRQQTHPNLCLTCFYFFSFPNSESAWTFPNLCATHCCITPFPPSLAL